MNTHAKKNPLPYWGPVFLWMAVIFLFSTRQRITVSEEYVLNFLFFKMLHLIEYGFLFVLTSRALSATHPSMSRTRIFANSLLVVVLYGASDELHQQFVPTREGAVRDVIIDGTGAVIAWIFLSILLPRMPRKLRNLAKRWDIPT